MGLGNMSYLACWVQRFSVCQPPADCRHAGALSGAADCRLTVALSGAAAAKQRLVACIRVLTCGAGLRSVAYISLRNLEVIAKLQA